MDHLPRYEFQKCVGRYRSEYQQKSFSCWDQFLAMAFAQFTYRPSAAFLQTRFVAAVAGLRTGRFPCVGVAAVRRCRCGPACSAVRWRTVDFTDQRYLRHLLGQALQRPGDRAGSLVTTTGRPHLVDLRWDSLRWRRARASGSGTAKVPEVPTVRLHMMCTFGPGRRRFKLAGQSASC